MYKDKLHSLCWAALAALAGALLISTWNGPDIWAHLHRGQLILQTGQIPPPVNIVLQYDPPVIYWLFHIYSYALYALGGIPLITLSYLALWFCIFFVLIKHGAFHRLGLAGLVWTLAAIFICEIRFLPRPEIFSFLFITLFIVEILGHPYSESWVKRDYLRSFFYLGFLQFLWCGIHTFFLWGPLLIAFAWGWHILEQMLSAARGKRPKTYSLHIFFSSLLLVLFLASMISPFGYKTWVSVYKYVVLALLQSPVQTEYNVMIQELMSPLSWIHIRSTPSFQFYWLYSLVTVMIIAFNTIKHRTMDFTAALAIMGFIVSITGVRYMPLVILFSFPFWSITLKKLHPVMRKPRVFIGYYASFLTVCCLLTISVVSSHYYKFGQNLKRFGFGISESSYPVRLTQFLKTSGFQGLIFDDSSSGGYLEFFSPELKVYGDSITADLSKETQDYLAAMSSPEKLAEINAMQHFDALILRVPNNDHLLTSLLTDPSWHLSYADLFWVLFTKKRFSEETHHFYEGEDLSFLLNGLAAITWSKVLCASAKRDDLLLLLNQLKAASIIPAPILGQGLVCALNYKDAKVLDALVDLKPKIYALNRQEEDEVERLFRQSPAGRMLYGD